MTSDEEIEAKVQQLIGLLQIQNLRLQVQLKEALAEIDRLVSVNVGAHADE